MKNNLLAVVAFLLTGNVLAGVASQLQSSKLQEHVDDVLTDTSLSVGDWLDLAKDVTEFLGKFDEASVIIDAILDSNILGVIGNLGPLFSVAGAIVGLIFGGQESAEMKFMKEQFGKVHNKLEIISDQIRDLEYIIDQSTVDMQFFSSEENIKHQIRYLNEYMRHGVEGESKERDDFIRRFQQAGEDRNIYTLYNGIIGRGSIFTRPILKTVRDKTECYNKQVKAMGGRLVELLTAGVMSYISYTKISGGKTEPIQNDWEEKLKHVNEVINEHLEYCKSNYRTFAAKDMEKVMREKEAGSNRDVVVALLDLLGDKFDWLYWMIVVYDPVSGFENHVVGGSSYVHQFRIANKNAIAMNRPRDSVGSLDHSHIRSLMKLPNRPQRNAHNIYDMLRNFGVPGEIHVVRRGNGIWAIWNAPANRVYFSAVEYGDVSVSVLV
ncbi:uncharacterized protein LOC143252049 [Tachypleus tridentatus]|uniref:uncharacterized protein LOC143252049 n=1 Tax=Tachypleus tridentatus TaxID=6853 RepID=UPI003FD1109A